jgi:hypothetical protein
MTAIFAKTLLLIGATATLEDINEFFHPKLFPVHQMRMESKN